MSAIELNVLFQVFRADVFAVQQQHSGYLVEIYLCRRTFRQQSQQVANPLDVFQYIYCPLQYCSFSGKRS